MNLNPKNINIVGIVSFSAKIRFSSERCKELLKKCLRVREIKRKRCIPLARYMGQEGYTLYYSPLISCSVKPVIKAICSMLNPLASILRAMSFFFLRHDLQLCLLHGLQHGLLHDLQHDLQLCLLPYLPILHFPKRHFES